MDVKFIDRERMIMNAFLTVVWFIIGTCGSFLFAHYMMPDSVALITFFGFIGSVMVRFVPEVLFLILAECL